MRIIFVNTKCVVIDRVQLAYGMEQQINFKSSFEQGYLHKLPSNDFAKSSPLANVAPPLISMVKNFLSCLSMIGQGVGALLANGIHRQIGQLLKITR